MSSFPNHHRTHLLHSTISCPKLHHLANLRLQRPFNSSSSRKIRVSRTSFGNQHGLLYSVRCLKKDNAEIEIESDVSESQRPPFDINLAVILAGFAFEAYSSPPENLGKREVDGADCETVYLSESFLREVYDGQLFIKLKRGYDFPAMDPWGTSDPYVVIQLNGQVVKSKVKWGTKEPTWNEDITLYIKQTQKKNIQVAAWDANLVAPHKRMGNAGISLEGVCDGTLHAMLVELEGMGGGGKIELEVKYKSFDEIGEEKNWWRVPFISEFLRKNGFESSLKTLTGSETVQARQFVEYAFGQLRSLNDADLWKGWTTSQDKLDTKGSEETKNVSLNGTHKKEDSNILKLTDSSDMDSGRISMVAMERAASMPSDEDFWKSLSEVINQNVVQKVGLSMPEILKWDGFELLNKIGVQSRSIAEAGYVESGLATKNTQDVDVSKLQFSLPDIKKATNEVLRQTDSVLGALLVLTAIGSQSSKDTKKEVTNNIDEDTSTKGRVIASGYSEMESLPRSTDGPELDEKKAEEMKTLFLTAETAMEAWAMLATSLGQPSFIKSEFEKLCFLDNTSTDTQIAIWRDSVQRRLVVAFRGTEQTRWKDLVTDLMLAPTGLNPERIGGDAKQEVQVHSGFLSAYDSVRKRIISLVKLSIGCGDDDVQPEDKWHVYVTGHSLGGALATLLALELETCQLAKHGALWVTMYNFGSPRVGNKNFAEVYNEKVKDSWRVVNHRDIIPTIPRLMGYCHVAQPVYLAAGDLSNALENIELSGDGYQVDVIGESTPDVLVNEFMKGEKELIGKLLQTEINIFLSIRDGSALMQHMEDFYYITLLENVRLNYNTMKSTQANDESGTSSN